MLEKVIELTNEYIEKMPKAVRKKYGQFFTSKETAQFMASMFTLNDGKRTIRVLDAGAGSGVLTCALIESLEQYPFIENVDVTCYETDKNILELLHSNLTYCKEQSTKNISYHIISENYILSQAEAFNNTLGVNCVTDKFDYIIGNPPYQKIGKNAEEAKAMPAVCYGTPNMYFLFATMGLFNLRDNGEMVYIIPRSWTSGAYFKKFREYFLTEGKLRHIHLFVSRNKVFDKESVLQETVIVKVCKTKEEPENILVTSSESNNDFENNKSIVVPYNLVVSQKNSFVYLVTNDEEVDVLEQLHKFNKTLPDIGLKMKTGLTVDFRNRDLLRNEEVDNAIPLFFSQHIKNGKVQFPVKKENEYVVAAKPGLQQDNKNYLFVKRFTAKEEYRRLQCGVYLAKKLPQYLKISTQNKINFIENTLGEMSECLVYGLYVLFNSSIYDKYYRILNGSTQVNSTEVNTMPVPDLSVIQDMGQRLLKTRDMSEHNCDMILEAYFG